MLGKWWRKSLRWTNNLLFLEFDRHLQLLCILWWSWVGWNYGKCHSSCNSHQQSCLSISWLEIWRETKFLYMCVCVCEWVWVCVGVGLSVWVLWLCIDPDGSARVLRVLLAAVNSGAVCHRTVSHSCRKVQSSFHDISMLVCMCEHVCMSVCVCVYV